jgi:hypothetical protein
LHPELWGQPEEATLHQREDQLRRIREDQLRRVSQLVPEQLRQRLELPLQALLRGDPVDREELQSLVADARQLPEPHAAGEPARINRARLEEEWRQVEELVQGIRPTIPPKGPEGPGVEPRQISQLVPEPLRQQVEQHLQALLRADRLDREGLRSLLVEARQLAELQPGEGLPEIDRARLDEEWRQVEELVQRLR